jgi:hypothetical protein
LADSEHVKFDYNEADHTVTVECDIPEEHIGRQATFTVHAVAEVKDSDPKDSKKSIFSRSFQVENTRLRFELPFKKVRSYAFKGSNIHIVWKVKLKIDDGIIFDTTYKKDFSRPLSKPPQKGDAAQLIDPKDHIDYHKNIGALSFADKVQFWVILFGGMLLITVLTLGALVIDFRPSPSTSSSDDEGSGGVVTGFALVVDVLVGFGMYWGLQGRLRRYMTFNLSKRVLMKKVDRNTWVSVTDLVQGRSKADLEDVTLRVVACNMEKGQYYRGSGSDRTTVDFSEPIQAILLFEQKVDHIAAGTSIREHFSGEFGFAAMFDYLYPPNRISANHGIDVYWEVQLLVRHLIDQELVGPVSNRFRYEDFFQAPAPSDEPRISA